MHVHVFFRTFIADLLKFGVRSNIVAEFVQSFLIRSAAIWCRVFVSVYSGVSGAGRNLVNMVLLSCMGCNSIFI